MDRRLTDALDRHPQVSEWSIRRQRGDDTQIYLTAGAVEAVRQVEREAYEVQVHVDRETPEGPTRGTATLPVEQDDVPRFAQLLDEAVAIAGLVRNPPWTLADPPSSYPEVALADGALATPADATAAGRDAVELIRSRTDGVPGIRLSAAELFLTAVEEELATSRGISATARSTRVLLELVLLAAGDTDEAEFIRTTEARRVDDLGLDELLDEGITLAADATRARMPGSRTGPVVVSGMALEQLMSGGVLGGEGAYLAQTSASTAYAGLSRLTVGESVYLDREPTGDLLTLRANARHPFGVPSYRFDEDGLPAADVPVVERGILVGLTATQRYAQYLGVPATGRPGIAEVEAGRTPLADLLAVDGPVIHVLAFSAPNVDLVTGNFGMEIRIGYEVGGGNGRDRRHRVPVKGGSVTGNLFEAMAAARFSSETAIGPSFAGPAAIRLEEVRIAGAE